MSEDVFVYKLEIALEFQRGRLVGWSARASSPRSDYLFPLETDQALWDGRSDTRALTDWVRNSVHEIKETEWFETR